MKLSRSAKLAAVLASVGLTAGIAATSFAASTTTGPQGLIEAIASKFNLDKTQVEQVFTEHRQQMETEKQQKAKERLAQAVTDGKITQAQADQITAKVQELKTYEQSLSGKTEEEKRTLMKTKFEELQTWITENNIPREYVMGLGFGGHHKGPGMRGHRGGNMTPSTNQTQTPATQQ